MKRILTSLYLNLWLLLIRRFSLVVDMEMVDGTPAAGKVRYSIGFRLPDGKTLKLGQRTYER